MEGERNDCFYILRTLIDIENFAIYTRSGKYIINEQTLIISELQYLIGCLTMRTRRLALAAYLSSSYSIKKFANYAN